MAIIRPVDDTGGERQGEDLGSGRSGSSEHAPPVAFTVPDSVWDLDAAVVVADRPETPEPSGPESDQAAAARSNHPSMWTTPVAQPPLTVVRDDEPLPVAGDAVPAVRASAGGEPWLEAIVHAATSARILDSADAWRAVASAADLVSEMARALELVAEATHQAVELQRAAREEAATAERAQETAQATARDAKVAARRARNLEAAVAVARQTNSAERWSEVCRVATDRRPADHPGDEPRTPPDIA